MAEELGWMVEAFCSRPLDAGPDPEVGIDGLVQRCREGATARPECPGGPHAGTPHRDASRWGPQAGFVGSPKSAQIMDPIRSIFDRASAEGCGSRTNASWGSPRSALRGGPAPRRERRRRGRQLP
jgi:hypothetical protein